MKECGKCDACRATSNGTFDICASAIIYLMPVAFLVIGYVIGEFFRFGLASAFIFFFLSLILIVIYDRHVKLP